MVTAGSANLIQAAGKTTVGNLFHSIAAGYPERTAIRDGEKSLSYAAVEHRSNCLANFLVASGVQKGDRIAVLTKNRHEYFELLLAAAKVGAIVAALNWRLLDSQLAHCVDLVSPSLIVVSGDQNAVLDRLSIHNVQRVIFDHEYEALLTEQAGLPPGIEVDPEDGLVILYTSGTTGLPKGALISHRAMIARGMVYNYLMQVPEQNNFIAWTPFYHMVATDHGLATLLCGGTVWCVDGFQPDVLIPLIAELPMGWFILVPGMVGTFNEEMKKRGVTPRGIGVIGAMPDLIPGEEIAEATRLLNAPFLNTFGATETGLPPGTGGRIPIGEIPRTLSKTQSPFCDLKLVDGEGNEVPVGEPGEATLAGATLFSGYWNNDEVNREDFRGGRFHMGDVLRRNGDGTLDYVDRVKYMIKSGGENIYPAEIESVITADPGVETAIVVRRKDDKWGEVPVAFVVRTDESVTEQHILEQCRKSLAGYKKPKAVFFIDDEEIPRSTTGKIQRHILEERL